MSRILNVSNSRILRGHLYMLRFLSETPIDPIIPSLFLLYLLNRLILRRLSVSLGLDIFAVDPVLVRLVPELSFPSHVIAEALLPLVHQVFSVLVSTGLQSQRVNRIRLRELREVFAHADLAPLL